MASSSSSTEIAAPAAPNNDAKAPPQGRSKSNHDADSIKAAQIAEYHALLAASTKENGARPAATITSSRRVDVNNENQSRQATSATTAAAISLPSDTKNNPTTTMKQAKSDVYDSDTTIVTDNGNVSHASKRRRVSVEQGENESTVSTAGVAVATGTAAPTSLTLEAKRLELLERELALKEKQLEFDMQKEKTRASEFQDTWRKDLLLAMSANVRR